MKPANYAPVYAAALYPQLAEIARSHGYALAAHGSLARDFDVICVPWADQPSDPEVVLAEVVKTFDIKVIDKAPTEKNHGRLVWTVSIGFGDCRLDFSFMPRQ